MVANVTGMKSGILANVNMNVKTIKRAKNIRVGILLHVFVRKVSLGSIIDDAVIRCDEIINTVGDVSPTATGIVSTNFCNEKIKYKIDYSSNCIQFS